MLYSLLVKQWVDLENNVVFKTLNKTCDMFTINLFKRLKFYVTYNQSEDKARIILSNTS